MQAVDNTAVVTLNVANPQQTISKITVPRFMAITTLRANRFNVGWFEENLLRYKHVTFRNGAGPYFSQESIGGWGFREVVLPTVVLLTTEVIKFLLRLFKRRILRC